MGTALDAAWKDLGCQLVFRERGLLMVVVLGVQAGWAEVCLQFGVVSQGYPVQALSWSVGWYYEVTNTVSSTPIFKSSIFQN